MFKTRLEIYERNFCHREKIKKKQTIGSIKGGIIK